MVTASNNHRVRNSEFRAKIYTVGSRVIVTFDRTVSSRRTAQSHPAGIRSSALFAPDTTLAGPLREEFQ